MQERIKSMRERIKPMRERIKPMRERIKPMREPSDSLRLRVFALMRLPISSFAGKGLRPSAVQRHAGFDTMAAMHKLWWMFFIGMISVALAQEGREFPVDPQTGRTIGAKEISPEELKRYIDEKTKALIIDVRDPDAFAKQTIEGAINIPIDQLETNLKNIPKDTALFFT